MVVGLTRGDVLRLRSPRRSGHEQRGARFGVVVDRLDADELVEVDRALELVLGLR